VLNKRPDLPVVLSALLVLSAIIFTEVAAVVAGALVTSPAVAVFVLLF
jgi:hypothetical protein